MTAHIPTLRRALSAARALGFTVARVPHTGELRVSDPRGGPSVRLNARRKDAPRALLILLDRRRAQ